MIGYPDASYNNNPDKSTQRGLAIFIANVRLENQPDAWGSLVDYESTKIKRTVLSTTVSELYGLMKCFGTCMFMQGLWMDMTGEDLEIHIRTDANNLVTTATKTTLPEQKETIHMISSLRSEACSGSMDDLAHVVTDCQMADCLTKDKPKAMEGLKNAVETGRLPQVDTHPPFRVLMQNKHKAYFTYWLTKNIKSVSEVSYFLMVPVRSEIQDYLSKPKGFFTKFRDAFASQWQRQ